MRYRVAIPAALVSGVGLALAFPEPDLWPLAWVALAPCLYLTTGSGPRRGALVWAVFAVAFFGTVAYWVSIVGWLAWSLMLLLQTSFLVGFGAVWGWLSGRVGTSGRIALAGGTWAAFEYARAVIPVVGFTWGQLAQSQHDVPWLLEWSSVGGAVFLSLVIAAANAALAELVRGVRTRHRVAIVVSLGVIAAGAAGPMLISWPQHDTAHLTVALVQGNVDPLVPQDFEKDLRILNRHVALTEQIDEPVDLVVWPESSTAIDPDNPVVPPLLQRAAAAVGAPIIAGGTEDVGDGADRYQVMAFLVSPRGEIVDSYQKTHLVPFGEYIPARDLFDWIPILDQVPRDAVPGDERTIFNVAGGEVAAVLSFEGDFGSLVRSRVAAGGRLVIVATNTSTWRRSWASAQHVAFSQVRAVENQVPVMHAALSGISAVISEDGRVISSLPMYEQGTMIVPLRFGDGTTWYARFGDPVLFAAIVLCLAIWVVDRRRHLRIASD